MIFLTKFEASGFKSFAQNITIDFKNPMIGIVGPNGSGKSNIVDAIKWVLGERSSKTLRGKTGEDVIFHGSHGQEPSSKATVSLTFDNKQKFLHFDDEKIKITRKLTRGSGENEYYINDNPCRLKDIQEIFLDTGLSKGSLGIISQGTVQWFVEAKPEERRNIFEEAAGIGFYVKKKNETNAQLERVQINLDQLTAVVNELSSDVKKLTKQAEKAQLYAAKKKELTSFDLTILAKDVLYYKDQQKKIESEKRNIQLMLDEYIPEIKFNEQALIFSKNELEILDSSLEEMNIQLTTYIEQINKLEIKKQMLNSKLTSDINSGNNNKKANALKQIINVIEQENELIKENLKKIEEETSGYEEIYVQLNSKKNELGNEVSRLTNKITEVRVQTNNLKDNLNSNTTKNKMNSIILANKNIFLGLHGLVHDFFKTPKEYELCINTSLGKNLNNFIVEDLECAYKIINFLKTNKIGLTTFLPLKTIKPTTLKEEHIAILQTLKGYKGLAIDLISYDQKFANVFKFLLGNVIVAEDTSAALSLSKYTYQMYRVISLDGTIINPHGAIVGGYLRENTFNSQAIEAKILSLQEENKIYQEKLLIAKVDFEKTLMEFNKVYAKINEKKLLAAKYNENLKNSDKNLFSYKNELDISNSNSTNGNMETSITQIVDEINNLNLKKDKLNEEITISKQTKLVCKTKIEDQEAKFNENREKLDKAKTLLAKCEIDKVRCDAFLENARTYIINTYKMDIDYVCDNFNKELPVSDSQAREIINKLKDEISSLGSINTDAINELEEKKQRYENLTKQQNELIEAKNNLLLVISQLDLRAKISFETIIQKVNETLPTIFKYMFGGGTCLLEYVDPQNTLVSGIDVIANLPGKNFVHLNLLSGGEKTLVALSILFSILKIKSLPLIILDEAESALDPANVERFGDIIHENSKTTQFIVVTHRQGTMARCDELLGATMRTKGVTTLFQIALNDAKEEFSSEDNK